MEIKMNERIQKLALQAGEYVNSVYTPPVRSKTPGKIWEDGHIDWHPQFNEKFAELIVRECIGICNDTNDASYLNGVIAGRKIKQHFGVE